MEGLAGVGARISALSSQVVALTGASTASTSGAAGSGAAGSTGPETFADALAAAVTGGSPAGATTSTDAQALAATFVGTGFSTGLGGAAQRVLERAATVAAAPVAATVAAAVTTAPAVREAAAVVAPAASRELTSKGIPVELASYGNGRIPAARLTAIGAGERLWAPAAEAFSRLRAAAAEDGVRIGVNDSYRSYDEQVSMAERKGLRSQGGLAAAPGTSSHGWGMALDLQLDGRAQTWMRSHAGSYGFAETVSGEPWHWGYTP